MKEQNIFKKAGEFLKKAFFHNGQPNAIGSVFAFGTALIGGLLGNMLMPGIGGMLLGALLLGGIGMTAGAMMAQDSGFDGINAVRGEDGFARNPGKLETRGIEIVKEGKIEKIEVPVVSNALLADPQPILSTQIANDHMLSIDPNNEKAQTLSTEAAEKLAKKISAAEELHHLQTGEELFSKTRSPAAGNYPRSPAGEHYWVAGATARRNMPDQQDLSREALLALEFDGKTMQQVLTEYAVDHKIETITKEGKTVRFSADSDFAKMPMHQLINTAESALADQIHKTRQAAITYTDVGSYGYINNDKTAEAEVYAKEALGYFDKGDLSALNGAVNDGESFRFDHVKAYIGRDDVDLRAKEQLNRAIELNQLAHIRDRLDSFKGNVAEKSQTVLLTGKQFLDAKVAEADKFKAAQAAVTVLTPAAEAPAPGTSPLPAEAPAEDKVPLPKEPAPSTSDGNKTTAVDFSKLLQENAHPKTEEPSTAAVDTHPLGGFKPALNPIVTTPPSRNISGSITT